MTPRSPAGPAPAPAENDAAFGLGFAHGQDRAWLLELARRVVAGRLAEVFGERALDARHAPRPGDLGCRSDGRARARRRRPGCRSRAVVVLGHRQSRRHGDMVERWARVESIPMRMDRTVIEGDSVEVLRLRPR
jgi:hypothetical protein